MKRIAVAFVLAGAFCLSPYVASAHHSATMFDNTRVTSELGRKPVPFSKYSYPLLKFSRESNFSYRYEDWPAKIGGSAA